MNAKDIDLMTLIAITSTLGGLLALATSIVVSARIKRIDPDGNESQLTASGSLEFVRANRLRAMSPLRRKIVFWNSARVGGLTLSTLATITSGAVLVLSAPESIRWNIALGIVATVALFFPLLLLFGWMLSGIRYLAALFH
jgi:hypothetical protein